jgi:hypothetical protein
MGTYTVAQRQSMAKMNPPQAMPDGSYPIGNKGDISDAVRTWGLGGSKATVKAWIIKRAQQLNATSVLPDGWAPKPSGSVEHSDLGFDDFLEHHGVLGMHWGQHKAGSGGDTPTQPKKKQKLLPSLSTRKGQNPDSDKKSAIVRAIQGDRSNKQFHKDVAQGLTGAAFSVAIVAGSKYLEKHPEIFQQAANKVDGTKAIDAGYQVIKLTLGKSGSYVLK